VYCLDRVPAVVKARPELADVEPCKTGMSVKRDAIAWLVDRLRWERTLEALRSTEDGRTEQAA
jgi:hypothetical protein